MNVQSMFAQAFGSRLLQANLLEEYRSSFVTGADPSTLDATERAVYDEAVKSIARASSNRPTCGELFRDLVNAAPPTLDVKGNVREKSGGLHLTPLEQTFFAEYGVLPPIRLDSVRPELVESVDSLCSALITRPGGCSSSPAWIFDRDLLMLVTHPEIVDRVASLIGDSVTFLGSDGPMYLPPNSRFQTAWHSFDAEHFGGGGADSNLQVVSVWVALSDATIANGCMKMAPGSFRAFTPLEKVLPKFIGLDHEELIQLFINSPGRVEPDIAARVIARRLNARNFPAELMRFGAPKNAGEKLPYNPFAAAVDRACCLGDTGLAVFAEFPRVALEAKKGDAFFFTSTNEHGSFKNTTPNWRKAISFRYVKTATVSKHKLAASRLAEYVGAFEGADAVLKAVNRPLQCFEHGSPRLCVRGSVPPGQEQLYFDANVLEAELAKRGGSVLPRIDPLP